MLYILYESDQNHVNSVLDDLYERYPKSSRVLISGKKASDDVVTKLSGTPLFSNGWLIICSSRIGQTALKKLNVGNNLVVITVFRENQLTQVVESLGSIPYKIIDNHKVDPDKVIDWIEKTLVTSHDVARMVYKRCDGRLRNINEAVAILSTFEFINRYHVTHYVEKVNTTSVNDVVLYMFNIGGKGVSREDVMSIVFKYRYGFPWLLKTVQKEIDTYLKVYEKVAYGELTLANYASYKTLTDNKTISAMPDYKLKRMVMSFEEVSFEYAYYVKQLLATVPKTNFGLCRFLQILTTLEVKS